MAVSSRSEDSPRKKASPPASSPVTWFALTAGLLGFGLAVTAVFLVLEASKEARDAAALAAQTAAAQEEVAEAADAGGEGSAKEAAETPDDLTLGEELTRLKDEVGVLSRRAELARHADEAIAYGYRSSLNKLTDVFQNSTDLILKDAANAEITRVQMFYLQSGRLLPRRIPVKVDDKVYNLDDRLNTKALSTVLLSPEQSWQYRSRAAQLLGNRADIQAVQSLYKGILLDSNLSVVYQATSAFRTLTGCPIAKVFGDSGLGDWLQANQGAVKQRIDALAAAAANAAKDAEDKKKAAATDKKS